MNCQVISKIAAGLLLLGSLAAQTPDVENIMAQVAVHQDESERLRAQYLYTQKVRIRALHSNGKLSREEYCVYSVLPTEDASKKELKHFEGRYGDKGQIVEYQKSGEENPHRKIDVDAGLLPSLRDDLINDKESKDGLGKDLFPLNSDEEKKYAYTFAGEETFRGRPVYRIRFRPGKKAEGFDDDDQPIWAGEALIDKQDRQALRVTTQMAKGIPLWVRTIFGFNLRQLGFTVSYARFDPGVYFPVSYGGEFDVKAVFVYKRTFTISLENTDFRRAEAESKITYAQPQ
jgi:hypothetical protein